MTPREGSGDGEGDGTHLRMNAAERVATLVSAVLVLGLLGVIVRDAVVPDAPASLSARTGALRVTNGRHHLDVHVRNDGDLAAQAVGVHVELMAGDSVVADGEATVDWLPGHSTRQSVMVFRADPRRHAVRVEVRGYTSP